VPGHGLLLDGDGGRPAVYREVAYAWLTGRGVDDFAAARATEQAAVERAHWAGDKLGFVGEGHEQAQPVTVVHLPDDLLGQAREG
jgi:hypothetical protein